MIKTLALGFIVGLAVAGCNHTVKPQGSEASTITYTLPETHVKIDTVLTLKSCSPLRAKADITILPLAAPSDPDLDLEFTITGSNLQSFNKSRDFKVDIYPHGALKSVNAATADKTANIIGGVIKLAATFAALGAQVGAEPMQCNAATNEALTRYTKLKAKIADLRDTLESAANRKTVNEQIDALAQEIARLETGELQVKLSKVIQVARKSHYTNGMPDGEIEDNGVIKWERNTFAKWLKSDGDIVNNCVGKKTAFSAKATGEECQQLVKGGQVDAFSLAYCIKRDTSAENAECPASLARPWTINENRNETDMKAGNLNGVAYLSSAPLACVVGNDRCPTTLVFRDPVPARMIVSAASDSYASGLDSTMAKKDFGVAQWAEFTYIDLSAGFGESKTISLSLDEFGRKTQFGWISNARGEGIVSGFSSIAEPIGTYRTSKDGENLANMKGEIDELETTQKLNKLRKCESIIENGGFVCPEE